MLAIMTCLVAIAHYHVVIAAESAYIFVFLRFLSLSMAAKAASDRKSQHSEVFKPQLLPDAVRLALLGHNSDTAWIVLFEIHAV